MSRRRSKRPVVPGAERGLEWFKGEVMRQEGYTVNPNRPDDVKYEVAKSLGIPLGSDNGNLTTKSAGRIGGPIGGAMVREMVRMAKKELVRRGSEPQKNAN